jgi:PleD family two-component response regulator
LRKIQSRITSDTRDFGNLVVLITDLVSQVVESVILAVILWQIDVRMTLSIGVSSIAPGMTVNECVRRADVALARAKAEGRNRTIFLE